MAGQQIVLDPQRLRALVNTMAETRVELASLRSAIGTIAFVVGEASPTDRGIPECEDWLEFEGHDILNRIAELECRPVHYDFLMDTLGISSRERHQARAQMVLQRLIDRLPEEPLDPHTYADIFGLVPIAGDYVDGAHAVWYATEGDMGNALLSGISVVPLLGSLIGQAIKHGDELAKVRQAADLKAILHEVDEKALQELWGGHDRVEDHLKHLSEFGFTRKAEYLRESLDHLVTGLREGWPAKYNEVEETLRVYNPRTNTLGSYWKDGGVRTLFKPDPKKHGRKTNMEYWEDQPGEPL